MPALARTFVAVLVLALPPSAGSAATSGAELSGPTTQVLDDFDGRGSEDPLYQWGNWAIGSIDGSEQTLEILGGAAGHNEGDNTATSSYRVAGATGDHEAYASIAAVPDNDRDMYVYVNLRQTGTAGWDGYRARWFHWIAVDGLYLEKVVDGVATSLVPPVQIDPAVGDTILVRSTGSNVELWHESGGTWTLRLSASDSTFRGGTIGIGTNDDKGRWDDFGGTGATTVAPTPPAVPATGFLDQFERGNEDPLAQIDAWFATPVFGAGQTLEVLGLAAGQDEGETVQANSFRTDELVGDAEVHARIAAMPDNNQESYLYLHLQQAGTAAVDGYRARWFHWISTDGLYIQRIVDGVATTIAGPLALDPATGDTLLLRRFGLTLELWRKSSGSWTKLLTAVDGSYTSGRLGLGLDDEQGRWDDFGGGALGAPPPPPPPPTGEPPPEQTFGADADGSGVHGACGCSLFADPVSSRTGAFTTAVEDLALSGTGVSFAWQRTYNSADEIVGRFGPGWADSYSAALQAQPDGSVRLHGEDGQQLVFARDQAGGFDGPPGARSTLSETPGGFRLVRADQVVYLFDPYGRLLSMKDRNAQGVTLRYDGPGRLATVTDASGRAATLGYGATGFLSRVETEDGRSVAYGYTAGRLTSVTDVRGKTWTYTYDAGGRLASVVDPLSHTQVANVYDGDGRVRSQTDALGKTTTFDWNDATESATATDANQNTWMHDYSDGVLVETVDPLGNETRLERDDELNPTSVTGPTGETTELAYDAAGNLLSATAPASLGNARKTLTYNGRNDVELVTDARGTVTAYAYDTEGNLEAATLDGVRVGSYSYDAAGRVTAHTDANEHSWTYSYFPATGYLRSAIDPLGNETTYTYDDAGRISTRVDPKGNVAGCSCAADFTWTYTYDDADNQLSERSPLGHTTTNAYDDAGRLTSTRDALGHVTSYAYDDANRLVRTTSPDPDGSGPLAAPVTSSTYDAVGNKLTDTDPRGNTTSFAYDSANRLVSTTGPDPDGAGPLVAPVSTRTYDTDGNVVSTVEPRGNVSGANADEFRARFTYDAAGRLLTETSPDPDGPGPQAAPLTTRAYDLVGNLESVRDGNGHVTRYAHDAAGRVLTVTAPDLGVSSFTYDDAGNVLTRRDDNDHVTTFGYDAAGRLASETSPDPDGPGPLAPAVTTHTYDANGNRRTTTDANGNATAATGDGITTYGYDRDNRLTSIDYSDSTPDVTFAYDATGNRISMTDGGGTETRTYDALGRVSTVVRGSSTIAYGYDSASNVTRRTYPGSTSVSYAYDGLDRLSAVASGSGTTSYAYDPASNLVRTTLPSGNGYVETRAYDRAGRLTEVKSQRGSTVLSRFVTTLDAVGNPTQLVRSGSLSEIQTFAYDAGDRVTAVCFQAGPCAGASDPFIRWTYDRVGNRLTEQRPTGPTTYAYDARDRLLSAGSTTFTYDQNGNQTAKGSRTFTYDLANRLRTTRQGSTTTTYLYDGDDVRLRASTGTSSSSVTSFLSDTTFGLPQLVRETNGSGSTLRRYVHGLRPLSLTSSSSTAYYLYDQLGSVSNMTSSGGSTRWTYSYEPFGSLRREQRSGDSAPTNFLKFTGEYLDPTGLYHLRARQYDAASGRFTAPDPISPRVGEPADGQYVYVANRPTLLVDPSGQDAEPLKAVFTPRDTVGVAVTPDVPTMGTPNDLPQRALCMARRGYPLARTGEFNGGVAAHRHKHRFDRRHLWQNENAIDLNVPVGTGVCAVFGGRISSSLGFGVSSEGHRFHLVGSRDIAFYTHLSAVVVRRGQSVARGELVGYSGCGSERVPHLHLALERGNPERYAPPYKRPRNYGRCP